MPRTQQNKQKEAAARNRSLKKIKPRSKHIGATLGMSLPGCSTGQITKQIHCKINKVAPTTTANIAASAATAFKPQNKPYVAPDNWLDWNETEEIDKRSKPSF